MAERNGYEAKISEIDAKIQHICKELGIDVGLTAATKKERRTRVSGADIEAKILDALRKVSDGMKTVFGWVEGKHRRRVAPTAVRDWIGSAVRLG